VEEKEEKGGGRGEHSDNIKWRNGNVGTIDLALL
jgi:hypothetical protein